MKYIVTYDTSIWLNKNYSIIYINLNSYVEFGKVWVNVMEEYIRVYWIGRYMLLKYIEKSIMEYGKINKSINMQFIAQIDLVSSFSLVTKKNPQINLVSSFSGVTKKKIMVFFWSMAKRKGIKKGKTTPQTLWIAMTFARINLESAKAQRFKTTLLGSMLLPNLANQSAHWFLSHRREWSKVKGEE